MTSRQVAPLTQRPLDLVATFFFLTHIPITILIDIQPITPKGVHPQFATDLVSWYASEESPFFDPFYREDATPPWFKSFLYTELFFQLPFFFFALACFVTGDKRVRVPMLVYGGHVMTTLLPILSEFFFRAEDYGLSQQNLMWLFSVYLPYLIIPCALTLKVALYFDEPFLVHQSSKGAKLK